MSKQSIFVRHKDEIFNKLIETLEHMPSEENDPVGHHSAYSTGYKDALKWSLYLITDESDSEEELPFQPEPIPGTEDKNNE